jgi:hypothetical protein
MLNQKTAKRLRKIAMGMVVAAQQSKPDTPIKKVAHTQDRKTGQVRVAQNTWKGAYKALKRAFKSGQLPKNVSAPPVAAWNA